MLTVPRLCQTGGEPRLARRWPGIGAAAAVLLAFATIAPVASARAEWVPVQDVSLIVPPGSALDLSRLSPAGPAGRYGRVVASPSGRMAFESSPEVPARLQCASLAWSPASGSFPDKATADLYAAQLRIHGYNLARFHEVEAILMTDRQRDFDFDPEQLDRFHYLLAALKREGIYWMFDIMTSQNGAVGDVRPHRWIDRHRLKLRVHVESEARRHWRRIAETLYATPNPYTGIAPLQDPALALVILVNENGAQFTAFLDQPITGRAYPPLLRPAFNQWLKAEYGDDAALRRAWGEVPGKGALALGSVALPQSWSERGPRMRDTKRFFRALEADTLAWMEREIRALGYRGLVSMYNNWLSAETHFVRERLQATVLNTYFDEVGSYDPGATIKQASSLDESLQYIRAVAAARWLGKPFVLSEFSQPFWNTFRREAGLFVPAYGALQGWDAICRHSHGAIDLSFQQTWPHKQRIMPYGAGLDPVQRAGETLSALLFHRRDVAEARATAAIPFGRESDMLEDGLGMLPDSVTAAALVVRAGLTPWRNAPRPGAILLPLSEGSSGDSGWQRVLAKLAAPSAPGADAAIRRLRAAGALPAANVTDVASGVYESDTGEVLIDAKRRFGRVVTPRTEAASFVKLDAPQRLGVMTLARASGPAMVAASALDGAPLAKSSRILIIVATDAMNTGMTFRDRARKTVRDFGRMPVRIKRETVDLVFNFNDARPASLRALHLNGAGGDRMPARTDGRRVSASIDNAAASHGPTTYFLLERRSE